MKKVLLFLALGSAMVCANAQTIQEELNSQQVTDRDVKIAELSVKSHAVETTGLNSVDGLANSCMGFLNTVISTNDVLKEYKTEVKDKGEGEVEITKYRANLNQYIELAAGLTVASTQIAQASQELPKASDDVKTVKNPRQIKPVKNSIEFSKEALPVCLEEISFQIKLVNNLIETIKASNNN